MLPKTSRVITKVAQIMAVALCASNLVAAQSDSGALEEIIVTATKRESNLQDTPIAIAAFSMNQLDKAGINNVVDLPSIVPGLHIGTSTSSGANLIALRGVSSTNIRLVGDPTVAYHVDGIYRGRQTGGNIGFYDLARVEVVKGPQGTLYGRNATAGSINVVTTKPKDYFEANVDMTVGSYDLIKTRAMVNLPVSDVLSMRLAVGRTVRDGYQDNGPLVNEDIGDEDEVGGRLNILFTPNDTWSALFGFEYSENKGLGGADRRLAGADAKITDLDDAFELDLNTKGERNDRYFSAFTEINYDLGPVMLTYLGSYYEATVKRFLDFDRRATLEGTIEISEISDPSTSHELRITSDNDGPLEWLVGLYRYEEEVSRNLDLFIHFGGSAGLQINNVQPDYAVDSSAVFANATYSLNEQVRLNLGLRYTDEEKSNVGESSIRNGSGGLIGDVKESWTSTDWRVGIDWTPIPDTMLYASVSTGFKSGGFNAPDAPANALFYEPEEIVAYQVGHKSRFLDGSLQVNSELFYYDYSDLQLTQLVEVQFVTENAATATVYGVETDIAYVSPESLRVNLSLAYLNATFDGLTSFDPVIGEVVDLSDETLPKAPEWSITASLEKTFQISSGFSLTPRLAFHWEDDVKFRAFNDPGAIQASNSKTDFILTLRPESNSWYAQAYVYNIDDDDVYVHGTINGDNSRLLTPRAPRTIGISFSMNFGGN